MGTLGRKLRTRTQTGSQLRSPLALALGEGALMVLSNTTVTAHLVQLYGVWRGRAWDCCLDSRTHSYLVAPAPCPTPLVGFCGARWAAWGPAIPW